MCLTFKNSERMYVKINMNKYEDKMTNLIIMPSSSDQISKVKLYELISILILVSRIKVLIRPFINRQKDRRYDCLKPILQF